ncbi:MAG TPA: hypothetical protein PLR71_14020 [Deltaproteobacteria bacterium]|nr:hypothetical protein [Deltaproteobacteria bacterium]
MNDRYALPQGLGTFKEVFNMMSMFVAGCVFIGISIFIKKMSTIQ